MLYEDATVYDWAPPGLEPEYTRFWCCHAKLNPAIPRHVACIDAGYCLDATPFVPEGGQGAPLPVGGNRDGVE